MWIRTETINLIAIKVIRHHRLGNKSSLARCQSHEDEFTEKRRTLVTQSRLEIMQGNLIDKLRSCLTYMYLFWSLWGIQSSPRIYEISVSNHQSKVSFTKTIPLSLLSSVLLYFDCLIANKTDCDDMLGHWSLINRKNTMNWTPYIGIPWKSRWGGTKNLAPGEKLRHRTDDTPSWKL